MVGVGKRFEQKARRRTAQARALGRGKHAFDIERWHFPAEAHNCLQVPLSSRSQYPQSPMNFFRKLFGKKPAAPEARPASVPASPAPKKSPPENLPPVTASSIAPSASETLGNAASGSFSPSDSPSVPPGLPAKIETTLLTIDGPVWLPGDSPAIELFPAKPDNALAIAFIGGSAELPAEGLKANGGATGPAFALDPGALARALPLYLADQVELGTEALTRTLVSWMVKPRAGFILGGKQWEDSVGAHHARRSPADDPSDYLVLCHLVCTTSPWRIELRLVRTIDSACLAELSADCDPSDPADALPGLTTDLLAALANHADLPAHPSGFSTPKNSSEFLARLDQMLVLRTAALPGAPSLRNVDAIIEGIDAFARAHADNLPARLLFTHALASLAKLIPAQRAALASRAEAMQRDLALAEPAQSVLARIRLDSLTG
jgi:hypothetical protein